MTIAGKIRTAILAGASAGLIIAYLIHADPVGRAALDAQTATETKW